MVERTADQRIRTTEWEDIQYKHGNRVGKYATNELGILAQRVADAHVNTCLTAYDPLAEKARDRTERDGADDEDEALAAIRRRRAEALRRQQMAPRFGALRHVPGAAYTAEVTEASAAAWVVALLVRPAHTNSERLLHAMRTVAQRRQEVKFVAMHAAETVRDFPERHLPCVLLYRAGELRQQLTELAPWTDGARGPTVHAVERVLHRFNVIQDEELDAEAEEEEEQK